MNILQAIDDPEVFGRHFADAESWEAWRAFVAALFGLEMTSEERAIFRECTGRASAPSDQVAEAWLVVGRRGGKSFVLATIAVFLACFRDWRPHLTAGERATVMVIAADRKQARVIFGYVMGLLKSTAMLAGTIQAERQEAVDLSCGVTVEIQTASFRTVRGYTVVAALLDEVAFWRDETSANPDAEVIAALRPAMSTVPGAMLLAASSPYARRGALWSTHRRHFGKDGPVLVWQADTRRMNPRVPQSVIDAAYADDPASAAAEYGANFRSDVETFISRDVVDACTSRGVRERAPLSNQTYQAFVDPSGGSADSMTMAIGHREGDRAVLDCVREVRPPFSPSSVVEEFSELLRAYRARTLTGDRYAGEWPREQFAKRGITYRAAAKPKSDLYREMLAPMNSGRVDLLDHDRLASQLSALERRTARGGRDSIDHAPGAHDDVANAVAGLVFTITTAAARRPRVSTYGGQVFRGGTRIHGDAFVATGGHFSPPWETAGENDDGHEPRRTIRRRRSTA
ncbi:hypothetical protein [Methyloligella solikamskensis]|uniref:Terminase n=1 Tax=Methyloligella solikamskensis TaxID=1177756 RepID=A0ABW3JBZ8_9HYPH